MILHKVEVGDFRIILIECGGHHKYKTYVHHVTKATYERVNSYSEFGHAYYDYVRLVGRYKILCEDIK